MSAPPETPFDSLEGSHRYMAMLNEVLEEARADVGSEIGIAEAESADRRKEALQIVAFKLNKLSSHITASRRILNDLVLLRRLLLEDRTAKRPSPRKPGT